MLTLFVKTGCPYCEKVLAYLEKTSIQFETKNISEQSNVDELISLGGKRQVPFLVHKDVMMYESDDIIAYLGETFSKNASNEEAGGIRLHRDDDSNVCDSCQ